MGSSITRCVEEQLVCGNEEFTSVEEITRQNIVIQSLPASEHNDLNLTESGSEPHSTEEQLFIQDEEPTVVIEADPPIETLLIQTEEVPVTEVDKANSSLDIQVLSAEKDLSPNENPSLLNLDSVHSDFEHIETHSQSDESVMTTISPTKDFNKKALSVR